MIIRIKIDLKKLDASAYFRADSGAVYADITLLENRDGPDQYGHDFMVTQDLGKERREKGEKGPILGNGKIVAGNTQAPPQRRQEPQRRQSTPGRQPDPRQSPGDFEPLPFD